MKFVLIPSSTKDNRKLSSWNYFYKTIQAVKSDKAKRPTK